MAQLAPSWVGVRRRAGRGGTVAAVALADHRQARPEAAEVNRGPHDEQP